MPNSYDFVPSVHPQSLRHQARILRAKPGAGNVARGDFLWLIAKALDDARLEEVRRVDQQTWTLGRAQVNVVHASDSLEDLCGLS
jgi:hypothetical protein